ncbi:MAG: FAD:protein FMN transferase [Marinilabiliaceae bacterium]|nr:FAD:protein FMN transferase [Marinilabiliaceae bacterium]
MKSVFGVLVVLVLLAGCRQPAPYVVNEGMVFGTTYRIVYQSEVDYHSDITSAIEEVNQSWSPFEKESIITRVNQNDSDVVVNDHFINVFDKSVEISKATHGAFDITVAPLVNAWGFGFKKKDSITTELIDSLRLFVGMEKVLRVDHRVMKQDGRIMLDASAIAKGYGVDVAALCLEKHGVANYLVEIGGEVRTKGVNTQGQSWRVGIDKPIDDPTVQDRQLQAIVALDGVSLATSGNYRNFYVDGGRKFAHTIHPQTGYPVQSDILSASVIAPDCMTADAYATAFMVLGSDRAMAIVNANPSLEAFFICTDSQGEMREIYSPGFEKIIVEIVDDRVR